MKQNKIDLLIVGAQKAGTSAINQYLGQHPEIAVSNRSVTAEFSYFTKDEFFQRGFEYCLNNWFEIPIGFDGKVVAKHVAIMYSTDSLRRVHEFDPSIKLLVILRDPVDRAISAFKFYQMKAREKRESFIEAFQNNYTDYYDKGNYLEHLNSIYTIFNKEQVTVLIYEDFKKRPNQILNSLCGILGLSEYEFDTSLRINEGGKARNPLVSAVVNRRWGNIKNIIPLRYRIALKATINRMNQTNRVKSGDISLEDKMVVYSKYKDMIVQLEKRYALDLSAWKKLDK